MADIKPYELLLKENNDLQVRVAELEETLRAIQSAEVDALVVPTEEGNKLFLMQSTDDAYRLLVEEMQEAAVTVAMDGTIIYCNRCFAHILNYQGESLLSKNINQFLVSRERESFKLFLQEARIQSGISREFSLLNHDHHIIPVHVAANILDLKLVQVICLIITDLTEVKRLEAALLKQEKLQIALDKERELGLLKSRMMERITHEFRTPLTIIQISTETLIHYIDRLTAQQRIDKFNTIQQTNIRLTEMLDEIAMVVTNKIQPINLSTITFNIHHLIQAIVRELEAQFGTPGKFRVEGAGDHIIKGDWELLKLAFLHILRNAVRFSPRDSVVRIHTVVRENSVEVSIIDMGIGMLPDEQIHIFDPFFRGSNMDEIGGLGLGLTIAQRAIQAHHGTIMVESVLKEGSTFRVMLPT